MWASISGSSQAVRSSLRPGSLPNTAWVYAGPKDQYVLAEISPNLDLTIDYGFWFLAAPIYWLLRQIDSFINNYGLSIIALTLVVKALFYKLTEPNTGQWPGCAA